jgi:hypothetical protein
MKKIVFLFWLCFFAAAANAQEPTTKITVDQMQWVAVNSTWKFGDVNCESTNKITSILLSMNNVDVNNETYLSSKGGKYIESLDGVNPRTILILFSDPLDNSAVNDYIKGIVFTKNNRNPGTNPSVKIEVDANPTKLPTKGSIPGLEADCKINAWTQNGSTAHPDSTMHYYVWVPVASIFHEDAYNQSKNHWFRGMRGYLTTITSKGENDELRKIAVSQGVSQEAWSAGARTPDDATDALTITRLTKDDRSGSGGEDYKWMCGPETGQYYYYGPTYEGRGGLNPATGKPFKGPIDYAYNEWNNAVNAKEPNNWDNPNVAGYNPEEYIMQINYDTPRLWNDYSPTNGAIRGFVIEFGGSPDSYTVPGVDVDGQPGVRTWAGNPNYAIPNNSLTPTTNNQWVGYSPGNSATTTITFKPNVMRSRVMVFQ